MSKGYTITAVILSKDARAKLEQCLISIAGWVDEIILVDGNSTDGTIELARRLGASVYAHSFLGAFSAERNFGIEKATSQWVLQLDSDEVVTKDFKKKCDEVLPTTRYVAFKFMRKNCFLGHTFTYGGWYHFSLHLLKRGFAHYEGRVHEKMIVQGEIGQLVADVLHFPFDSMAEFVDRQNRYTGLQAQDILDTEGDLDTKKIKYNLTWKPLKLFKKMYLNKKGYKEGMHGLIFAIFFSYVHFIKWAKVWENLLGRAKNSSADKK